MPAVAGLFGKLPAHGDFIRCGWPDETLDAVDQWLTAGIAALRGSRDEDAFAEAMHAAPLCQGYVPAGRLGPLALHLAIAPSIDRVGRLFPVAAGRAGEGVWAGVTPLGEVLDAAIYDAVAGRIDAAALIEVIGSAATDGGEDAPPVSVWWTGAPCGDPTVKSDAVDAVLLERLLFEGVV